MSGIIGYANVSLRLHKPHHKMWEVMMPLYPAVLLFVCTPLPKLTL